MATDFTFTLKIGVEADRNPELTEDLWAHRGVTVCGSMAAHLAMSEPLVIEQGGRRIEVTDPATAALIHEVITGVRALRHRLPKE